MLRLLAQASERDKIYNLRISYISHTLLLSRLGKQHNLQPGLHDYTVATVYRTIIVHANQARICNSKSLTKQAWKELV